MANQSQRCLRQFAMSRDLAAIDCKQWRLVIALVEHKLVVARNIFRLVSAVIIERTHAGEGPHQLIRRDLVAEIGVYRLAQVGDFGWVGRNRIEIPDEIFVCGSNQSEILSKGQSKYDASVYGFQ